MLTHGIPPEFRGGVHIFLPAPHTIGSVPSLSGHAIAYRLRSLPRVRWHRASSPQGSSSNGCCLCITMDQKCYCAPLFSHTHYWYTVNIMSKLSGVFSSHSFWTSSSLDVPAGVTQEEGHTGFLIHLLSAVRALIFLARRIQPFLSLVDCEVEFCVLTT